MSELYRRYTDTMEFDFWQELFFSAPDAHYKYRYGVKVMRAMINASMIQVPWHLSKEGFQNTIASNHTNFEHRYNVVHPKAQAFARRRRT